MTMHSSDTFVLLDDFASAYDLFALKAIGIDERLERHVRGPMRAALAECVGEVLEVGDDVIESQRRRLETGRYFVITLDGGSYFSTFDFSFEITRAAYAVEDLVAGNFFRIPRESQPQFNQQAMRIRRQYEQHGNGRPIVLCDDGIGTGRSLLEVILVLDSLGIAVHEIVVLINPSARRSMPGQNGDAAAVEVPVTTLVPTPADVLWLSERDLYWGLPRSGISLTPPEQINPCFGLPYTIDTPMVEARVGLVGEVAERFRESCLTLNGRMWRLLEQHHGRPLWFEDCPRLAFIPEYFDVPTRRIGEFLEEINHPGFRLDDLVLRGSAV